MNDTLKVAGRIGAELGAAKAENDRLRGLLTTLRISLNLDDTEYGLSQQEKRKMAADIDAELSRQSEPMCETMQRPKAKCGCPDCGSSLIDWPTTEPTDTYTAVEMATAAAQGFRDGQAAVEPAPAQDEQAVAAVIGFYEGEREPRLLSWNVLPNGEHRLYTRPAQTEQQPVSWQFYQDGKWWNGDDRIKDHRENTEAAGIPVRDLYAAPIAQTAPQGKFRMGDLVKKSTGSEWQGRICGTYSTTLTPEGYAVESEAHAGSVQIYPAKALEAVDE